MSKEKHPVEFAWWERVGIGLFLLLIVASPYMFSQWDWGVNFLDKGGIGDTIGGITAPFVNLLAAYLVYKSFTAQISANKQLRTDHDEQMEQLNKEHTFNYISNYFDLIKSKYPTTNLPDVDESIEIWGIYDTAKSLLESENYRITHNLDNWNHSNEKVREATKETEVLFLREIKIANTNIGKKLESLINQTTTIITFDDESEKSDLDEGIKMFYKFEMAKIVLSMELDVLVENVWKSKISEASKFFSSVNNRRVKQLKINATLLKDRNFGLTNF